MVTIGDSFSIVATLAGLALTFWCFTMACALLFPGKVSSARTAVSLHTRGTAGAGFLALVAGFFGLIILQLPNPGAKLLGLMMVAGYFAVVAVGSAGISMLAGERLSQLRGEVGNNFDSFAKAAFYIVVAGMLPVLGWFLFAPLYMLFAGGAGLRALMSQQTSTSSSTVI